MPDSCETQNFLHYRVVCAWVERISSAPFSRFSDDPDSRWTARCRLDDPLVEDYRHYFEAMKSAGVNFMVVWGLFGENWPVDPTEGISQERADRVRRILQYARECGVGILVGFSGGYQVRSLLTAHPELAEGAGEENPSKTRVDFSKPDSVKWAEKTLSYLLDNFDIAGFNLEPPLSLSSRLSKQESSVLCDLTTSPMNLKILWAEYLTKSSNTTLTSLLEPPEVRSLTVGVK